MNTQIDSAYQPLEVLVQTCDILASHDEDVPVSVVKTFLRICLDVGLHGPEPVQLHAVAAGLNLPVGTVSRHLRQLGDWERINLPGMGLVRTDIDPHNRRQKIIRLTAKGTAVAERMRDALARGGGHAAA